MTFDLNLLAKFAFFNRPDYETKKEKIGAMDVPSRCAGDRIARFSWKQGSDSHLHR
jgi:hypothetical protein